jgi:hypothetical protein
MTKDEALNHALQLVSNLRTHSWTVADTQFVITAIKKALAQPEQEPVAFEKTVCPFCTSEWVTAEQHDRNVDRVERTPLTDEEIMNIAKVSCIGISPQEDTLNFAKVIEAVHGITGEKNGAR